MAIVNKDMVFLNYDKDLLFHIVNYILLQTNTYISVDCMVNLFVILRYDPYLFLCILDSTWFNLKIPNAACVCNHVLILNLPHGVDFYCHFLW